MFGAEVSEADLILRSGAPAARLGCSVGGGRRRRREKSYGEGESGRAVRPTVDRSEPVSGKSPGADRWETDGQGFGTCCSQHEGRSRVLRSHRLTRVVRRRVLSDL